MSLASQGQTPVVQATGLSSFRRQSVERTTRCESSLPSYYHISLLLIYITTLCVLSVCEEILSIWIFLWTAILRLFVCNSRYPWAICHRHVFFSILSLFSLFSMSVTRMSTLLFSCRQLKFLGHILIHLMLVADSWSVLLQFDDTSLSVGKSSTFLPCW